MSSPRPRPDPVGDTRRTAPAAGFTLIEMMVALLLFALISLAGVSLVETVARMQRATAGRADRLADIQRALFLVDADFSQLGTGPDRAAGAVGFTRFSGNGDLAIRYWADLAGLHRTVDGSDHVILTGVQAVGWRFAKHGAWVDAPTTPQDASRPRAVELTLRLKAGSGGVGGPVRRITELPANQ
ncbi:type II secretion system protein GspJ [Novosphingobium sp.]|uniref:type II secretion system protein GspJ n=1 Tax=Novosphingobium sp. TaxID=1874826 RepID=UPI003B515A08